MNKSKTEKTGELFSNLNQTSKVAKVFAVRFFNENKNTNVTYNEFEIILAVKNNEQLHQRDLARCLIRSSANLSRDIASLEKKGFIERCLAIKDNRMVKDLKLTDKGLELYEQVSKISENYIKSIENIYTDEEHKLLNSLLLRLKNKLMESVDMVFE